jgi:hypothetical protein
MLRVEVELALQQAGRRHVMRDRDQPVLGEPLRPGIGLG